MKTNKTTKSFLCNVTNTLGHFVSSVSVTSPKTGRTLTLKEGSYRHCPKVVAKVQAAAPSGGKGQCFLTAQDLRSFLEATESAREDYKASMNRDKEVVCTAGLEETDGECEHCDAIIRDRMNQGRGYQLHSYEGGL